MSIEIAGLIVLLIVGLAGIAGIVFVDYLALKFLFKIFTACFPSKEENETTT